MFFLSFLIIFCALLHNNEAFDRPTVYDLQPKIKYKNYDNINGLNDFPLNIYCYSGEQKSFINIWQTLYLKINSSEDFIYYEGATPEDVEKDYRNKRESWTFNPYNLLFNYKKSRINIDPYRPCIGIVSSDRYTATLIDIRIDYWRVLLLGFGLFLVLLADHLSRNAFFIYLLGTIIGIGLSVAIAIYFLTKPIPKRPIWGAMLISGWAVGTYFIQYFWDSIFNYLIEYKIFIFWYTIISAIISFCVCYRWGPIENPRTVNIIRWFLQFSGFAAIYFSTSYKEGAIAQIIILSAIKHFPKRLWNLLKRQFVRMFPPKRKLLTEEEYQQEAIIETNKGLEELRSFCKSSDCDQWELILRCKDPVKLASFIQNGSHISEKEMEEYDRSNMEGFWPQDTDEEYEEEESSNFQRRQNSLTYYDDEY